MINHKEFNSKFFEIGLRTSYFLFSGRKVAPASEVLQIGI